MIFGELGIIGELEIVGSEERPTYKKKGNNYDTTISNIGIQNYFATSKTSNKLLLVDSIQSNSTSISENQYISLEPKINILHSNISFFLADL